MTELAKLCAATDERVALFGWKNCLHTAAETGSLCSLGAPTDQGNGVSPGAKHGPVAIRDASLRVEVPKLAGFDIGDIDRPQSMDHNAYLDRIGTAITCIHERDMVPMLLGGDHSITFAPVSVLQGGQDICLIWLDAHTDFSPVTDPQVHNHKQVLRRISALPGVRQIIQIGYRGITVGDERSLGARSIVITSRRARLLSARDLISLIPDHLPCYISIDIDVVDPVLAPGTSAPVPGGLSLSTMTSILRTIVRSRKLIGVDIVEVNPALDEDLKTSLIAAELAREIADNWGDQRNICAIAGGEFDKTCNSDEAGSPTAEIVDRTGAEYHGKSSINSAAIS